eukprot:m.15506 g.15506  ORF g.15506 m.15506 type:complete len:189 (-) comp5035_c1_seq1:503-1069(-)
MGQLVSTISELYRELFVGIHGRVLCLGLDGAGKTTALNRLAHGETLATMPTVGFNVETLQVSRNVAFTVWDIGGQDRIRPLWRHYFHGSCGLLFVVDSNDTQRIAEAKEELHGILDAAELRGCSVVVMANKQDLPDAMTPEKLTTALGLHDLRQPWRMVPTVAHTGKGVEESVKLLTQMVRDGQARAA